MSVLEREAMDRLLENAKSALFTEQRRFRHTLDSMSEVCHTHSRGETGAARTLKPTALEEGRGIWNERERQIPGTGKLCAKQGTRKGGREIERE